MNANPFHKFALKNTGAQKRRQEHVADSPPLSKIPKSNEHCLDVSTQADRVLSVITRNIIAEGDSVSRRSGELIKVARQLSAALELLKFELPTTHVYNPLNYAKDLHEAYVLRHGGQAIDVLLVGMNPGPFGMCQSGVPFGDCTMVKEYLQIVGEVGQPATIHPKRKIYGLDCPRREVSGERLWGWARNRYPNSSDFFKRFFVANYCPLAFMESSGRNRTPDKLPLRERDPLIRVCNDALSRTLDILRPKFVIGVGRFAEDRVRQVGVQEGVVIGRILHPSPANPSANSDWAGQMEAQLKVLGVEI